MCREGVNVGLGHVREMRQGNNSSGTSRCQTTVGIRRQNDIVWERSSQTLFLYARCVMHKLRACMLGSISEC